MWEIKVWSSNFNTVKGPTVGRARQDGVKSWPLCANRKPGCRAIAARSVTTRQRVVHMLLHSAQPSESLDVVLTQISPTRTFWSLAHSYILGGGKLVLKIKMSGAERFWCLRSLLASVASPCARTATWLVSSESPRPALSCRLSHVTLAAL